jgi:ABC-2 type transport system permease protein
MIRQLQAHVALLFLDIVRTPAFVIPTVLFPAMFYTIFGVPYARASADAANQILASFICFAAVGVALFQFGVGIATERGRPWERYLRSLPVFVEVRFASRVIVAMTFALMAALLVAVIGKVFTPVSFDAAQWATLALYAIAGAVPFVMLGIAIAYLVPPRGALPVTNIVYLLASFAGGFWMPPQELPGFAAAISPYLPTRQYGELLWSVAAPGHNASQATLMLACFTLAFSVVAIIGYRRDERSRYA